MKKTILLVVFILFVSFFLSATWNIGEVVDDFGDPTGEGFLYSLTNGTFGNSATSNSTSPMRVYIDFNDSSMPTAVVVFEPHAYDWDNPVEDFYDSSVATIKFKDDAGNVTSITSSNSKYGHNWNRLGGQDAIKVINLFLKNKTIKVSIKIESYSYNFTIDCSDFASAYSKFKPTANLETNKWNLRYSESSVNSNYQYITASILFDTTLRNAKCYGEFSLSGRPSDPEDYPYLSFNLYLEDKETGLFCSPTYYDGTSKEIKYNKISFTVGKKNFTFTDSYASKYFMVGIKEDKYNIYMDSGKLYDVLSSGSMVTIDIYTTEGDKLSFTTSASEFLKYSKYPY